MASKPRLRFKANAKEKESALGSEQRQLQEKQRAVQEQIEALQRSINEAPQRAAEERRRNEQAVYAATPRPGAYRHGATLLDTRHVEAAAASGRIKPSSGKRKRVVLREERAAGRQQTITLVILLALALCWAMSHFLT